MSNVAKLKKKAAELEERRHYDKALAVYEQVLNQMEVSDEEVDVSLFNRVGDLTLRQGRVTEAVTFYEKAVDLYTDGGFLNNAIALCNKILRNAPGRTSIYYKLGKISARKGFTSDAKLNFLEFADRMQRGGHWEEAFSALEEFADLCPDQDDVRLMLAEQLTRKNRNEDALKQLQILYGRYQAEGRATEANATLERMRALDPDIVPQVSEQVTERKGGDLIFLDLGYDEPARNSGGRAGRDDRKPKPPARNVEPPVSKTPPPGGAGRDPRLSGEMRVIHPSQTIIGSPSAGDGGPARPGDDLVLLSNMPPGALAPQVATDERSAGAAPMHDLALAGILPALQTPGLQAAPQIAEEESLHVEDVDLSDLDIVDVGYSGLTSSISDVGGQARELGTDVSGIELLEIERTGQDLPVMESRVTDSDLRITHDAIPTGSDSAPRETATSVADESAQPAEGAIELTSALSHESLKSIAQSDAELLALLKVDPSDFALRRRLGEVLVEDGKRTQGLAELERAMSGFEDQGAIADAISVAEEILRLEPNSIRYHQKRVEYAFRNNDQSLLIESYLELADALFRTSQLSKASVVYERVLELDPANARANYAVAALLAGTKDVGAGGAVAGTEAGAPGSSHAGEAPVGPGSAEPHDASFVNLGDMVRADDAPRSTRMVVEDEAPSGDEEADFAEMLEKFKRSLAENVDDEDFESHYDLGIAFREMGLLDEAIAQFQRALRGTRRRVRTLEALGQCFVERSQFQVAANVLERALNEAEGGDENLVGVLYLLGYACEAMQKYSDALNYYQRLFMVDIQFRDVTTRIAALEKMVT